MINLKSKGERCKGDETEIKLCESGSKKDI